MAELPFSLSNDRVWDSGEIKRGTAYDQHRKPVDFSRNGSGLRSFRKSVNADPLLLHTNTKATASAATKRVLRPTTFEQISVFENRCSSTFESSLPAVKMKSGGATENSSKEVESSISGTVACPKQDNHDLHVSTSCSPFHCTHALSDQHWTDECLGLSNSHAELSHVVDSNCIEKYKSFVMSSVSSPNILCNASPVQSVPNCTDPTDSSFLEQNDSDSKRVCLAPAAQEQLVNGVSSVANCSVAADRPSLEGSKIGFSPAKTIPVQTKRLKLKTKEELKTQKDNVKMTGHPVNAPRLSTEDEFNRLTVALPTEKIFIGRLSTQASDVKVGPLTLTASLSAAASTHNLKIDIKDVKEWKGDFNSEPFVMALALFPGMCQKLVNHLSVRFHLNNCKFYNTGSACTTEKYIVIPLSAPLDERSVATLHDIIDQQKGTLQVDIDFQASSASMHGLLNDVVANQLELMKSVEDKQKAHLQLHAVVANQQEPVEDKKKELQNPSVFTPRTRSSLKQSSILKQPSQSSVHAPLCDDEHKKLLIYNPSGSKLHFEITGGDLNCLHPKECLNDKIIDFYLMYLLYESFAKIKESVHIFSSFFLGKLMEPPKDKTVSHKSSLETIHDRVKSWTRHVDIFSKDYIVLPVCLRSHWFVAIVCYPEKFEPIQKTSRQVFRPPTASQHVKSGDVSNKLEIDSDESTDDTTVPVIIPTQEESISDPILSTCTRSCIIVLDSLGIRRTGVLHRIRSYLTKEWKVKRTTEKDFTSLPPFYPIVPLQYNNVDCGIYVLQYVESFLKSVAASSSLPQSKEEWALDEDLSQKRQNIITLITTLSKKQNETCDT